MNICNTHEQQSNRGDSNDRPAMASAYSSSPLSDNGGHQEGERRLVEIRGKDTVKVRKAVNDSTLSGKAASRDIAVVAASEFNSLREGSTMTEKERELARRRQAREEYGERMRKSKERKDKMVKMEEERKRNALRSTNEVNDKAERNSVLQRARDKLDEDMDDVKHMNRMMLYSKVATIRDAQVQEKRYIHAEREEEEQQLDVMSEIERLKALKMYEERNRKRAVDQRRGASVIIEQIKDRQQNRLREEEQRDRERGFILRQIEALKEEEIAQQIEKRVAAARLVEEVNAANAAALKIKEERLIAEKLEEQKIVEYQRMKEQKAKAREERLAVAEAAAKEAEFARLRAQQQRAQDKAADMDALRAKRAIEAAERQARQKELIEIRRLEAINEELAKAREKQAEEKERRLAEQAMLEREEFERIVLIQMQQEEAERVRAEEERQQRHNHCEELKKQIQAREEASMQARRDFLEEGNVVRAQIAAERKKLVTIKQKKIEKLKAAGVPEK
ncbi:splicing factor, putative [Perkinsus marinus ATCC 50983]|uniref:Cilia- and flagella-associated protein 45 n=1 Tax=Perkinsus marinus (strain ATCC 50983 / TXsc) TaxID=423536 RepID=C5LN30_PERM5|nr:splicing factor, putative [Perkinsus marinus ATCC 50983]EER01829.1 splicing factor, putative [Perkinsus marinus ATCC 50983]|eukprot:XP_002769111.1 splicing factor, putative [Perkinsus marinus ATCC 50983]